VGVTAATYDFDPQRFLVFTSVITDIETHASYVASRDRT